MKRIASIATTAALMAGLLASPALALEAGGVKIKGNVEGNVNVRTAINAALGARSKACQSIGSIGDNPACK